MHTRFILLFAILLIGLGVRAQPFKEIKAYTDTQSPGKTDSAINFLTHRLGSEFHFLYPFYQAIGWDSRFMDQLGAKQYYAGFAQALANAGDHKTAIHYHNKTYDSLNLPVKKSISDTVGSLKNIQYVPAINTITDMAQEFQVIMINEAPHKPFHRVFVFSLLDELYAKGYRYLALEIIPGDTVRNDQFFSAPMAEPTGAEMIRKARELGFTLVSYGDKTLRQRNDSIHALNILQITRQEKDAKIIVLGNYVQMGEDKMINDHLPVGYWIKKIGKINPLTIEQTEMSSGGNFEYGRLFYEAFTKKFVISSPSIITHNKRIFNPLEVKGYDLLIVHPPVDYQQSRAGWLTFNGKRKLLMIQPTEKTLFLVQAYYESEYVEDRINQQVPADQTYTAARDGYYHLYLQKGKYRIIMRDAGYKILSTKELIVE